VIIDDQEVTIPQEVLQHFRSNQNVKNIKSNIKIFVFDSLIKDRATYLNGAISFIKSHHNGPRIVFLDPDIGLEPSRPSLGHVLESEALAFWDTLEIGDIFVFYQHKTTRKKINLGLKQKEFDWLRHSKSEKINLKSLMVWQ
jgi:hypothetical protein